MNDILKGHSQQIIRKSNSQIKYPRGGEFLLEFKFGYFANGKIAKFKFCLLFILNCFIQNIVLSRNLSMIAYIIEIQKNQDLLIF